MHSRSHAKVPVSIVSLIVYLRSRLSSPYDAGLRDAAMSALAFFGVRRISEVLSLQLSDIFFERDGITVYIRKQKNDPNGVGMKCWVPYCPALGSLCPGKLLENWKNKWVEMWHPYFSDGPFFTTLSKKVPTQVCYNHFRTTFKNHFSSTCIGTHSLRKGGAAWLRFHAHIDNTLAQLQGGWAPR